MLAVGLVLGMLPVRASNAELLSADSLTANLSGAGLSAGGNLLAAKVSTDDLLMVEEAFVFSASMATNEIVQVNYQVAPGHYLYRERFAFALNPSGGATLGEVIFPPSHAKVDPNFKQTMQVYTHPLSIRVPLHSATQPIALVITAQGCAEHGICYPPMTATVHLSPIQGGYVITHTEMGDKTVFAQTPAQARDSLSALSGHSRLAAAHTEEGEDKKAHQGEAVRSADKVSKLAALVEANDFGVVAAMKKMGRGQIIAVFLLLGLLLSLTPCVLPMLPILAALIVGTKPDSLPSRWQGLGLAFAYVLGVSIIYTTLGVIAGLSGVGLVAYLQTPWVRILFALLLTALALAMFEAFIFQAPVAWQSGLTTWVSRFSGGKFAGGKVIGAFLMGAVSALVIGPCVAAPLAGALLYISQTGDVGLGAMALFALSWGMGVPLLVVGASLGHVLPKPGPWMNQIKQGFGMLLLGTAWWMLNVLLPDWVQKLGWAFLGIVVAVMLHAFEALPVNAGVRHKFMKGLGLWLVLMVMIETLGGLGAVHEEGPFFKPFERVSAVRRDQSSNLASGRERTPPPMLQFETVHSVAQLKARLATSTRPVLLDIYADWCVACRKMEQSTFRDPAVAAQMSRMLLLRADVTANSAEDRALLKHFQLFGPPAILFFGANGVERTDVRVLGFQDAQQFSQSLLIQNPI